jgi:formylglycine-generating enzyme required for sulfatase activity
MRRVRLDFPAETPSMLMSLPQGCEKTQPPGCLEAQSRLALPGPARQDGDSEHARTVVRIFLSYASPDRALIEPIRYALAEQGHDIFFDREDLQPGEEFDSRIRRAIECSELFLFFITPDTVDTGSYTLSELAIAQRVWPHPGGHVLPVVLAPVPIEQIPAYLKSVTLLEPVGSVTASVADVVHQIARERRRQRVRRIASWTLAILVPVALTLYWAAHRSAASSKDGAPSVPIAAGIFTMGDDEFSPQRKVYVSAFYIDQFEITTARYAKFMSENGALAAPAEWDRVNPESQGQLPVVGVSWHDADSYCRWAGKRLPTEAEWEKAARNGDARVYPWGNDEPRAGMAAYGRSAEHVYEGGVTPVGSHASSLSQDGVHDLAGNASEWVSDWYSESFRSDDVRDPSGPTDGVDKVIRGSGWHDPAERLQSARRYHASADTRADDLGFRCAKSANQ